MEKRREGYAWLAFSHDDAVINLEGGVGQWWHCCGRGRQQGQ